MPAANTDSGSRAVQKPKTKVKVKRAKPTPDTAQQTQARAQEKTYKSQAHAVRLVGNKQRGVSGSSPSGDRPQGREQAMAKTVSHRQAPVDPNTGRTVSTLLTPSPPRGSQQRGTSPSGDRPQGRASEMRAAPTVARAKKGKGPGGPLLAVVHVPTSYVGAVKGGDFGGGMGVPSNAWKVTKNAAADAAELAVTTPSSVAKLASTAVTHPEKVPGMLAQPYKDFAKHPIETFSTHPVSTALMLAPAARIPGRAVGRVARVAGKQTFERPAASLPATAVKESRTGSRDVVVRAVQSRKDAKNPTPVMTVKAVQKRVDEHYDASKQHTQRVVASAARQEAAKAKADGLSKPEIKAAVQAKVEGAQKGARTQATVRFAKEFGATWQVAADGKTILKPRNATEGHLHGTRAEADTVAARLNAKPAAIPTGVRASTHPVKLTVHEPGVPGKPVTAALRRGTDTKPLEFTVRQVGDKYAVLPKVAHDRMYKSAGPDSPLSHESVGSSKSTGAKFMRRSRGAFTQAVLPFSPKWLAGQGVEAGIRSLVAGAGPMDWLRMHSVVKRMNAHTPGAGDTLMEHVSGGQFGLTGVAAEFAKGQKSLAHEFAGTPLRGPAAVATAVGHTLPLRAVRGGFGHYSRFVMGRVNGIFENNARKAMAGQALKNSPFMERHIVGLTDKALEDAANGLHATANQVRLGRTIDRMYGKYSKQSPEMRTTLLHWTPFLPWFLNVVTFLTKVLPVDHPVQAALLADTGMATEEWRKSHDLSLRQANHVPSFLLGSYPQGSGYARIAHYTPFGAGPDVVSSTGGLVLPQIVGPLKNMLGIDWKGKRLVDSHGKEFSQGQDALRALVSAVEEQVPGASQAGAISGLTPRYIDKKADVPGPGEVLKKMLPTTPTGGGQASQGGVKVRVVKIKPVKVKAVKVRPVKVG